MDHNTPHDHFLICHQSQHQKVNRIKELKKIMQRWCTPSSLCNYIIIKLKDYYKMEIYESEFDQLSLVFDYNLRELDELLTSQHSIGWNYFIRGRLSNLFKICITKYYKTNKLSKKYKATTWMKHIVQGVWNIHLDDWFFFCRSIFDSGNGTIGEPTMKITPLKLVTKYYGENQVLDFPSSKQIWFKRNINECQTFSVDSLRRWISISKRIIKTFKNGQVLHHNPKHQIIIFDRGTSTTTKQVRLAV